jgi:CRP-like cAMP-binding protein
MMVFPLDKKKDCAKCEGRKTNVFCDVPDQALSILDKAKIVNHYKKGQTIFYSGNFPAGLYCVSSGVVRLENSGSSGNNHILRVVQGGGILGYRSLFADEAYEASAVVHEDATICLIPKTAITEILKSYPEVGLKLLSQVSKELRAAEARMCGLTDKNASERIAESLLFLKDNFKEQTWTRKEISEWAGTTPETVMRTLSDFADQKIIELKGRKINVLNKSALSEIANLIH